MLLFLAVLAGLVVVLNFVTFREYVDKAHVLRADAVSTAPACAWTASLLCDDRDCHWRPHWKCSAETAPWPKVTLYPNN